MYVKNLNWNLSHFYIRELRIAVDLQFVDYKWPEDHKQYSVICPVDSLFNIANNTVLRGG